MMIVDAPTAQGRPIPYRRVRLATPPRWLWLGSILLQVLCAAALTSYTFFFLDDWYFIAQARLIPFSLSYLRLGLFEHFSPISRLLDKLLVYNSTGDFTLAHSLELLMYGAAIAAFAFVVRTILGNRWSAFALTILFGQSLFLLRLLNWWTATANILPATIFGLIAFGAYLHWQRAHAPRWLVASLAAFFLSLLDYETAMLLPFYLLAVRLLVLADDLHPRAWIAVLRREWVFWAGCLALEAAAAINFYTRYYRPVPHPSLWHLLDFLVISVIGTFIPAMFAIKNPQSALGREPAVIVACAVVMAAIVGCVIYRRPRAWRCALAFALVAVITMVPLALNRAAQWGLHTGKELYYQQPLQFMFLILAAFAVRASASRPPPGVLARLRAPVPAAALLASAFAAYGALYVTSVHAMSRSFSVWDPRRSLSYARTFEASVGRTIARTSREPVLFNAQVPDEVDGKYDSYSIFFPMIDSHVRYNVVTSPMYVANGSGALVPVSFHVRSTGLLARATVLRPGRPAAPALMRVGAACVAPGTGTARLRIPLLRPLRLRFSTAMIQGDRPPAALRVFVRMPASRTVLVAAHGVWSWWEKLDGVFPPTFPRGTSGQYVPLDVGGHVRAIDLRLPGGACVSSLAVGSFVRVG